MSTTKNTFFSPCPSSHELPLHFWHWIAVQGPMKVQPTVVWRYCIYRLNYNFSLYLNSHCIYLQCGKNENLLYPPTKHFTSINQRVKEAHDIIKKVKKKQRLPFIFYRKWCGKKFAQNIRLHTSSIAKSISPKYVRYYELFRGWNCFDLMVLSLFRMMSLTFDIDLALALLPKRCLVHSLVSCFRLEDINHIILVISNLWL